MRSTMAIVLLVVFGGTTFVNAQGFLAWAVVSKLAEWAGEAAVGEGVGAMKDWLFSEDPNMPPRPIFGEESEAVGQSRSDCGVEPIVLKPMGQEPSKEQLASLEPDIRIATTTAVNYYFGSSSLRPNQTIAGGCLVYAARYGGTQAQRMLGYMYLYGEGQLKKDSTKYYELEEKAAAKHDVIAIYNLGLAFCYDWGLPQSSSTDIDTRIKKCTSYLKLAALQNFEPATRALHRFQKMGVTP